jgi:hypothetical protein
LITEGCPDWAAPTVSSADGQINHRRRCRSCAPCSPAHRCRRGPRPSVPVHGGPALDATPNTEQLVRGLMRVNHVGEVCAQALYTAQAAATPIRPAGTSCRRQRGRPTIWPGHAKLAWTSWARAPRCSTHFGMPVHLAWACWPASLGDRLSLGLSLKPSAGGGAPAKHLDAACRKTMPRAPSWRK